MQQREVVLGRKAAAAWLCDTSFQPLCWNSSSTVSRGCCRQQELHAGALQMYREALCPGKVTNITLHRLTMEWSSRSLMLLSTISGLQATQES